MDRLLVRTVTLEDAIRDVDDGIEATLTQISAQQSRCSRAVDVIVAEYCNAFAPYNCVRDAHACRIHVGQCIRIRHQLPDGGIKKAVDLVRIDIASGQNARKQFVESVALRDGERPRRSSLVETIAPRAPGQRLIDAEEMAIGILQ